MLHKKNYRFDWEPFLAGISSGKTTIEYGANRHIFSQGDPADSVFYLRRDKVKLAATSRHMREAIVAILGDGEFFGEGCLAGRRLRIATATAMTDCSLASIEKPLMARLLHEQHDVSEMFVKHLLSLNIRYEAGLVDQFSDSSEKRLARTLLLLAHFDKDTRAETAYSGNRRLTVQGGLLTKRVLLVHLSGRGSLNTHMMHEQESNSRGTLLRGLHPLTALLNASQTLVPLPTREGSSQEEANP